jgi:4-carboxymuconolactone decarboxylase
MRAPIDLNDPNLSEAQQALAGRIVNGPRGAIFGPMRALLHEPAIGDLVQQMGAHLRYSGQLPGALRELAILITAVHWDAPFEWDHHRPIGEREGLDPDLLDVLQRGETPEFPEPDQALVYRFAITLLNERRLPEPLFRAAEDRFGPAGILELMVVVGYYGLLALVLNGFEITD